MSIYHELPGVDDLDADKFGFWRLVLADLADRAWSACSTRRSMLCFVAGLAWVLAYICVGTGDGRRVKDWFETAYQRFEREAQADAVEEALKELPGENERRLRR